MKIIARLFSSLTLLFAFTVPSHALSRGDFWQLREYLQSKPSAVYVVKTYSVMNGESYRASLESLYTTLETFYGGKFIEAKRVNAKEKNKAVEPFNDEPVYLALVLNGGENTSPTDGSKTTFVSLDIYLSLNVYSTTEFPYWENLVTISSPGQVYIESLYPRFKTKFEEAMAKLGRNLAPAIDAKVLKLVDAKKKTFEISVNTASGVGSRESFFVVKEEAGDDPMTSWVENIRRVGLAELEIQDIGSESTLVKCGKIRKGVTLEELSNYKLIHIPKYLDGRYSTR